MMIALSHTCSISPKSWDVKNIVVDSVLLMWLIISLNFCLAMISNHMVGSSKKIISGLWIRLDTISHLILCPSDNFLIGLFMRSPILKVSIRYLSLSSSLLFGISKSFPMSLKVSIAVKWYHNLDVCPKTAHILYTSFDLFFPGSIPITDMFHPVRVKIPVIIFMVVDLPAPFGQMKAIFSHFFTSKVILSTAFISLYVGLKRLFSLLKNHDFLISTLNVFCRFFACMMFSFMRDDWIR